MAIEHVPLIARTNPFSPMSAKMIDKILLVIIVASSEAVRRHVHERHRKNVTKATSAKRRESQEKICFLDIRTHSFFKYPKIFYINCISVSDLCKQKNPPLCVKRWVLIFRVLPYSACSARCAKRLDAAAAIAPTISSRNV